MSIKRHSIYALLVVVAACGKDSQTEPSIDAPSSTMMPDAAVPICTCSPAAVCRDTGCVCPTAFIAPTSAALANQMIMAPAGYFSGAIGVSGNDGKAHSVVVTAAQGAALGQSLTIGTGVYVAVGYDVVTPTTARSIYIASAGTVTLTRRCAGGIAGTMSNVTLVEADYATLVPLTNGCTTTISSLAFDVGAACP